MAELLRMKEIWIGRGIVDIQYINSHKSSNGLKSTLLWWWISLRSRRLEVAGERENGRARGRHACLLLARPFFLVPTTSKRLLRRLVVDYLVFVY